MFCYKLSPQIEQLERMLIFSLYRMQKQNDVTRLYAEYLTRYHVAAITIFLTWLFGSYFSVSGYSYNSFFPHIFHRVSSCSNKHSFMLNFSLISPSCHFPQLFLSLLRTGIITLRYVVSHFSCCCSRTLEKATQGTRVYAVHTLFEIIVYLGMKVTHQGKDVDAKCINSDKPRRMLALTLLPFYI